MTYKEYDKVWLDESGMPSLIPPMIFRNGFTSYYYLYSEQIGDSRFSLNASGITGSATLMHTNTISTSVEPSVGSVIRNEEYIYFYNHKTDTNPFIGEIVEYKISDGSKTYIEYASSATRIAYDISMSFIEERKLIIFDWTYEYADTGHIYIVDFDTLTCTEQFTVPYEDVTRYREIRSVACIKDNNKDLHLLVIVDYYDHNLGDYGIEIRYKASSGEADRIIKTTALMTSASRIAKMRSHKVRRINLLFKTFASNQFTQMKQAGVAGAHHPYLSIEEDEDPVAPVKQFLWI